MGVVAHFEVPYYQYLNEASFLTGDLSDFGSDPKQLLQLYRLMVIVRVFDTKAIALQRTGKLGTYPSTRGQEAVFVGMGAALAKKDIYVPYYRDVGALIQRGVKLSDILLFWGGDERGNCFSEDKEDLPYSVPVGSQPLHAAGLATAIKIRQESRAVLVVCGDGGSSQGDFYEAMNLAGVWALPLVFVVSNNQWAISVPRSRQTGAQTIAQKAIAAGFSGEQVDGNDVIAVQHRVTLALQKARDQGEPTLLEILSYRQGDHTTADDASRYESKGIREKEWAKEPILRLRTYLERANLWQAADEDLLQKEAVAAVDQAVNEYLTLPPQPLTSLFDYLYATLPDSYLSQREAIQHG